MHGFLDVDGALGKQNVRSLEAKYGSLPPTLKVITGNEGEHYFFAFKKEHTFKNSVKTLGESLDIRNDGGFVVAPPSIHPNGNSYVWATDIPRKLEEAPEWLIHLLLMPSCSVKSGGTPRTRQKVNWLNLLESAGEGQRNDAIARLAGLLMQCHPCGLSPAVALELCQIFNEARCFPPLDEEEVYRTVNSIAGREIHSLGGQNG